MPPWDGVVVSSWGAGKGLLLKRVISQRRRKRVWTRSLCMWEMPSTSAIPSLWKGPLSEGQRKAGKKILQNGDLVAVRRSMYTSVIFVTLNLSLLSEMPHK